MKSNLNCTIFKLPVLKFTPEQKIHYTLRIASAMCFIGHGSFGIITKEVWTNYFSVFGISHDLSFQLMPYVGTIDILFGLIILFYPVRAVLLWLVAWGAVTALLRPLSGEPFAEFIERAGNFGAPLALLLLSGPIINIRTLFKPVTANVQLNADTLHKVISCLRIVVFLLLLGHGGLNLMEKKNIVNQYTSLGFSNGTATAQLVGLFEIIGAFAILIRPFRSLVLIFFIWKAGSELFYPHYEVFEWVERGGSYGALLALWFALDLVPVFTKNTLAESRNNFSLNLKVAETNYSLSNNNDYTK
ncbi:MAG: hypothetical protein ABI594_17150 [Ginsengibacter sp.]